jgi:hypothetical protein
MTLDDVKKHALQLAAIYAWVVKDLSHRVYDPDQHNLCSAVVEQSDRIIGTYFSYSNPSALPKEMVENYAFILGDDAPQIIGRGGMQDLHTEVRLINYLSTKKWLVSPNVIAFFSTRSVCATCREAILGTMLKLGGAVPFMAWEFKVELHGTVTGAMYPIQRDLRTVAPEVIYDS